MILKSLSECAAGVLALIAKSRKHHRQKNKRGNGQSCTYPGLVTRVVQVSLVPASVISIHWVAASRSRCGFRIRIHLDSDDVWRGARAKDGQQSALVTAGDRTTHARVWVTADRSLLLQGGRPATVLLRGKSDRWKDRERDTGTRSWWRGPSSTGVYRSYRARVRLSREQVHGCSDAAKYWHRTAKADGCNCLLFK